MSEVVLSAMSRLRRLMGQRAGKVAVLDRMTCIRLSDDLDSESEGEGGSKEDSGKNGTETPTGDQAPKNEPPKPDDTVIDDFDYGKPFEEIEKAKPEPKPESKPKPKLGMNSFF